MNAHKLGFCPSPCVEDLSTQDAKVLGGKRRQTIWRPGASTGLAGNMRFLAAGFKVCMFLLAVSM